MRKITLLLLSICALLTVHAQTWQTVFYDDFNRADGALGGNYTTNYSVGISQLVILNNEVKVASGTQSPAFWSINYPNGVIADVIRISCKFRAPNIGYSFAINARDNGINTYSAGLISNTDEIQIYSRDYKGNSTKLAGQKANLDINKTYFMEFTLNNADMAFRFVEVGMKDTITIKATDNLLSGNKVNLSAYYYSPSLSVYLDDFKIETFSNSAGIEIIEKNSYSFFPNPASDFITLNTGNISSTDKILNIYNTLGNLVKSEIQNQNNQQINIGNLSGGIYLVEIKSKEWTGKQKLIIKR